MLPIVSDRVFDPTPTSATEALWETGPGSLERHDLDTETGLLRLPLRGILAMTASEDGDRPWNPAGIPWNPDVSRSRAPQFLVLAFQARFRKDCEAGTNVHPQIMAGAAGAQAGSWMQENKGGAAMGDTGKKDKGKREKQKQAKHTAKEKRQLKREKKK